MPTKPTAVRRTKPEMIGSKRRRLRPQAASNSATEPPPTRDATGTGGASGGFNSGVSGLAGATLDDDPPAPAAVKPKRTR